MTAPAMAAPDGSVTVPVISPLIAADWPWASGWIVAAAPATKARSRTILGIEFLMVHFLFVVGPTGPANDSGPGEYEPLSERCGQQIRNLDCQVGCAFGPVH